MADSNFIAELVPHLRQVGLFSRCSDYELKVVAKNCNLRAVPVGEKVIAMGEEGVEMFLVLSGSSAVTDAAGHVLHSFEVGEYFGELAVLRPAPRTSDVLALTDCTFAVLSRNEVLLLLDSIPGVAKSMLQGLADTIRELKGRESLLRG